MLTERDIIDLVLKDSWRRKILDSVADLALPDWAIGAGFVRAAVWDHLHDYSSATKLDDIDVLYFDRNRRSKEDDQAIEEDLSRRLLGVPWSVHNQARMHLRNDDPPYRDTLDAISNWLETPTCVAITRDADGGFQLLAPYGIDDLCHMIVRPTSAALRKPEDYMERLDRKKWQTIWPKLVVLKPIAA